jgi:hypothetical protein
MAVPYGVGGRDDQLADMQALAQLEQASDELLRRHRVRGVYTEDQLRRKARTHECQPYDNVIEEARAADLIQTARAEMEESDYSDLVRVARLRERPALVVEWRRKGYTYPEIGRLLEVTADAARMVFNRAHARILRAMIAYPFYGWWTVYLSEVKRGRKKIGG